MNNGFPDFIVEDDYKICIWNDYERKAWCGNKIHVNEIYCFYDIDTAVLHRKGQGKLLICENCKNTIIKLLENT